jgi:hypothetical protein
MKDCTKEAHDDIVKKHYNIILKQISKLNGI